MILLTVAENVSEVADVFTSVKIILESIPGWNIFFGVAIVGAISGLVLGIFSRLKAG